MAGRSRRSTSWNRTRKLSAALIGALLLRDDYTCAYCLRQLEGLDFEIDHVIPQRRWGDRPGWSWAWNLTIACDTCNRRKGHGPVPRCAQAEVQRRIGLPVDLRSGRELGEQLYPWSRRKRERRAKSYPEGVPF